MRVPTSAVPPRLMSRMGHGRWGISTGSGSARLVAELVLGRSVTIPSAFDPGRFGGVPGRVG